MLLMIAFACFFVMFAAWLIVPNTDEIPVAKATLEPVTPATTKLQTQV